MAIKNGTSKSVIQRPRVVTPGWAAFDRLQRCTQGVEYETNDNPYPPITKMNEHQKNLAASCCQQEKTFSHVLQSGNTTRSNTYKDPKITDNYHMVDLKSASPVDTLKKFHNWADKSLIEDILAAVNNDELQASSVLKAMAPVNNNSCHNNFVMNPEAIESHLDETIYPEECKLQVNKEFVCYASEEELISDHSSKAIVEPEWEEEDIYLTHRRDAIKMTRAASRHSKAAANAFLRGDRASARKLSTHAKGERAAAVALNSKAARAIVSFRNSTNDIWKLDLHGLHASEALSILEEHLNKIESMQGMTPSTHFDGTAKSTEGASLHRPAGGHAMEALMQSKQPVSQLRRRVLHVVTGTGNHSRGQAALPAAVRGFLIENGYHFDDARPGVLAVRPKLRLR